MLYGQLDLPANLLFRSEYLRQWRSKRPGDSRNADVVRRFVREGGPRPEGRYRSGFLVRRPGRLAGRQLPQPTVVDAKGVPLPLDAVLGNGFALIGRGLDPGAWIPSEQRRRWPRLGTRLVCVLPAADGVPKAADETGAGGELTLAVAVAGEGFGGRWARAWGRCLLVRPDRFVAVDAAPDATSRALYALEERLVHGRAA